MVLCNLNNNTELNEPYQSYICCKLLLLSGSCIGHYTPHIVWHCKSPNLHFCLCFVWSLWEDWNTLSVWILPYLRVIPLFLFLPFSQFGIFQIPYGNGRDFLTLWVFEISAQFPYKNKHIKNGYFLRLTYTSISFCGALLHVFFANILLIERYFGRVGQWKNSSSKVNYNFSF